MLDPTARVRRFYDGGKAIGQLSYMELLRSLATKAGWLSRDVNWQKSYEYFDGLDDPYRAMDFFVDGRLQQASTASVLRINERGHSLAVGQARELLSSLVDRGILTRELPVALLDRPYERYGAEYRIRAGVPGMGDRGWTRSPFLNHIDPKVNAPNRFLTEFPVTGDFWRGNMRDTVANLPIPRMGGSEVFVGSRFWIRGREDGYSVPQMIGDMGAALAIIVSLCKAANANPGMSPSIAMGMRTPDFSDYIATWDTGARTDDGGSVSVEEVWLLNTAIRDVRTPAAIPVPWMERSLTYIPTRFAYPSNYNRTPDAWDFTILGPSNALWMRSANSLQRQIYVGDFEGLTTADAITDFAQIMNLLSYFAELPPHVNLHSCMYFHNYLLRQSYQQIGRPYGTSLEQYRLSLGAEYSATSQATAMNKAAQGFDFTHSPASLEGATVRSLAVALGAVVFGGPLVAGAGLLAMALFSIGALIADMNRDRTYTPDKGKSLLRDRYINKARGALDTNYYRYFTPETVLESRPCIIYE